MMKCFSLLFILFQSLFIFSDVRSQELEFADTLCGTIRDFTGSCPTEEIIEVEVSGVGVLGNGNYGLAGVSFDISQDFGFLSRITLEAPNGNTYVLASGEEGINSFPGYEAGTTLGVLLTHCGDFPSTSADVGNPDGQSFQPVDDFSPLNTISLNADGTWKFRFCGLPDGIIVQCCGLSFDNSAPTISCPPNTIFPVDTGECFATFLMTDPIPTDNCEIASFTYEWVTPNGTLIGPLDGDPGNTFIYVFDSGTSTITFTATDDLGLSALCMTEIVVQDLEPPTFLNCPSDLIVMSSTQPGECFGSVNIIDPTPDDNCEVASYSITYENADGSIGGPFPGVPGQSFNLSFQVGVNMATYLVTDNGGNTFECVQTITVDDNEAPVWDNSDLGVTIAAECGVDDIDDMIMNNLPAASDNCGSATVTEVDMLIAPGCGSTAIYTIEYATTDGAGNTNPNTFSVTIDYNDTTPPVISGIGEDMAILCSDPFPEIPAATAVDVCDGDLTGFISMISSIESGPCIFGEVTETQTFVYTVSDACGNSASESWVVTITTDLDIDLGVDQLICDSGTTLLDAGIENATYAWSTGATTQIIDVNTAGIYSVTVTTAVGCCAEDEISVTIASPPNVSATGGLIGCGGDAITIMGNSTAIDASFSWTGPGGFISSEQNPIVSQVGTYVLTVTSFNGCTASTSVDVISDMNAPTAEATGGSISCTQGSIQLMGSSTTTGVTYGWTGPGGFTSNDQNPIVSQVGTYVLTVTSFNGCTASTSVDVISDMNAPTAEATGGFISCTQGSIQLMGSSATTGVTYGWTGPGGFTSNDQNPIVFQVGTYVLTVTSFNGCTASTSVDVVSDMNAPTAEATGGSISCTQGSIQLMGSSATTGVTYGWTGPGGFTSNDQNPTVSDAGEYILTVTAMNGCVAMATAQVISDTQAPVITLSANQLTCQLTSTQITTVSSDPAASFSWIGPGGFSSTDQNPTVSAAGEYTVTATGANGCVTNQTITIVQDSGVPNASAVGNTLGCNSGATQLMGSSTTAGVTYSWSGPNGYASTDQNPMVTTVGLYTLTVTAPNGCSATATAEVILDENLPDVIVEGGTISCVTGTVQLMGSSSTQGVSYSWTGPNGFTSSDQNPIVSTEGTYQLTVTSQNGCTAQASTIVDMNSATPDANAFLGSINCQTSSIALNALSFSAGVTYNWTGPNGFTSNDQNTTISEAGTYILVVTAPNGCTSSASVVLDETITPIEGNVTSSSDGNASITVSGGKPPYTYSWDNGESTDSVSNLSFGSHFVIVTDANGCQKIFPFQVEMSTGTIDPDLIEYWKVYPTVTTGAFSIDAQFNIPIEGTIEIFTSSGKILEREELKGSFKIQKGFDISFMPGGIYFLSLHTEHGQMMTKIILAK